MAIGLTDDSHYKAISDAIRALHDGTETYTPAEMAEYLTTQGTELKSENVKKDVVIFGVTGAYEGDTEGAYAEGYDKGYDDGYADGAASGGGVAEPTHYLYGTPNAEGNIILETHAGDIRYNGAALPKLPEYDREAYPYAYLSVSRDKTTGELFNAKVWAYSEPIMSTPRDANSPGWELTTTPGAKYVTWTWYSDMFDDQSNEWDRYGEGVCENGKVGAVSINGLLFNGDLPWCNHNIISTVDGSVSHAPSAPIPLLSDVPIRYEGEIPVYKQKE